MDLLDRMIDKELLSDSEVTIADYLLQNGIRGITINELAEKTYTSNATVIRMCRKLGYDGFRSFKDDLIREMESRKYQAGQVNYNEPFSGNKSADEIIKSMGNLVQETNKQVMGALDGVVVNGIAKAMVSSRRVFICAVGDTLITAKGFANRVSKLNVYPILPLEYSEEVTAGCNITKDDCVVFLSYSMMSPRFLKLYNLIKTKECTIVAITSNPKNLISQVAKYRILIPPKEKTNNMGTFYSQLSFSIILNILYSQIYALNYADNKKRKQQIDDARSGHGTN